MRRGIVVRVVIVCVGVIAIPLAIAMILQRHGDCGGEGLLARGE